MWDHIIATMQCQSKSCPPSKWRHIADFQADASSSSSAPLSNLNPSLLFVDPLATSDPPQSPGYACAILSGHSVNNILLNLHAWTSWATDGSDNTFEETPKGDAAGAAKSISSGTDDPWSGEDVNTGDKVDPHKGKVLDLGILVAGAKELGKPKHYLLHTLWITNVLGL